MRQQDALIYLSGSGSDEIISDYSKSGQPLYFRRVSSSCFGGRFPANLSDIFPWCSFYLGSQRDFLMKEKLTSGAHGVEGRYPFLDPNVVQEYPWLTAEIKNSEYKRPLADFFRSHQFPVNWGKKTPFNTRGGFNRNLSEGTNFDGARLVESVKDGVTTLQITRRLATPRTAIFLHTDRPVRARPPSYQDLEVVTGWTASRLGAGWVATVARKFGKNIPRERQIHQTAKYAWQLEAGAKASSELWVSIDTDTVVQCDGAEIARRYASFGANLVISGEREWWPKWQSHEHDPWVTRESGPFPYPNAGAIAGNKMGWTQLIEQMRRMPRFPCCPGYDGGVKVATHPANCVVDDQHCTPLPWVGPNCGSHNTAPRTVTGLQAAMQSPCSMADTNRSESCDEHIFQYRVDSSALLFLSMSSVPSKDVVRGDYGRFKYAPTGITPCVLHFNGYSKGELIKFANLANRPGRYDAWAVPGGNKYEAVNLSSSQV